MVVEQERRREDTSCNYRICINNDATVYRRNGFFVMGFSKLSSCYWNILGGGWNKGGGANNECFMKKMSTWPANLHERATYFDISIRRICACNF